MLKILGALLGIFLIIDIGLAYILFNPTLKISSILGLLPKNCKVVDGKYCKTVTIVGNEKLNEGLAALFSLPKGTKIYSPVNGQLSYQLTPDQKKLPYHMVKETDGMTYFFVFEPETTPQSRQLKAGDVVGIATGKTFSYLKNKTLGISTVKNQKFNKVAFDTLFR